MDEQRVRQQFRITPEQDHKVKAIAALRRCTEPEVTRSAIDRLPDPEGSVVERLDAAGLLAPKRFDPDLPSGEELLKLEAEVDAWLESLTEPLGLSEAVIADRDGR
jgi:hypothetical protein